MALAKEGYASAIRGTTKANVAIDANGQIAPEGTTPAGTKRFSINKVNAENSLTDNNDVLNFFMNLARGTQDSLSNQMQVTWTAEQP